MWLKILIILSSALAALVGYGVLQFTADGPVPNDLPEGFWGVKGKPEDKSIRSFKIAIDEKIIRDLKTRLKTELSMNRYVKPLEEIGFEYGFNTNYLKKLGDHWLNKYDWVQREKMLNKYPHFKTTIDGLDIHFLHVKSTNNAKYKKTFPLLLVHGWPGIFLEFYKIIPFLTDPKDSDYNFEIVVPSLPGFGFSEGPARPGFNIVGAAVLFQKLMMRLGLEKYYTQGGDWGAGVTTNMAAFYPKNVKGCHLNFCYSGHPRSGLKQLLMAIAPNFFMKEDEIPKTFLKNIGLVLRETGYFHIQATKPDTVGVGLSNSPTGLAAYILEKFSTWTNLAGVKKEDGGLYNFQMDELIDTVMIYWVTNSITTSMRLYSEFPKNGYDNVPVTIPSACLHPPNEYFFMPEFALKDKYPNLIQYNVAEKGGHFTAFEVPEILAKDLLQFVKKVENPPVKKSNEL